MKTKLEFSAYQDFEDGIKDVKFLLDLSKEHSGAEDKYKIILKSAILSLATTFECFIEDVCSDFLFHFSNLRPVRKCLPDGMVYHMLGKVFCDESFISSVKHKKKSCLTKLDEILPVLLKEKPIRKINIEPKFSYGKHGANEVKNLFSKIGVDDIFNECRLTTQSDSMLDSDDNELDLKGKIDSFTAIRNNIIHQNASPLLTIDEIQMYIDLFVRFSCEIIKCLEKRIINHRREMGRIQHNYSFYSSQEVVGYCFNINKDIC
ncbi:MAE_28990/MAE_18760 family HEPN-like nuclease [Dickeya fangzhongdai]|uniref:MAE_28990/MAE_18760 family HEPN-like nuclease n=1 Tax=Dickeya fangzhongdai TaxID=1778540 RepID=UPI0013713EF6|nr:MAE_28990/MAE_18760 family HEPN-like nuclease [Dickeya fangzhongdai]UMB75362.1 MAE_28990/MAE_18760 family HEPN-like nuclease [Dickeya fangzhongdai]